MAAGIVAATLALLIALEAHSKLRLWWKRRRAAPPGHATKPRDEGTALPPKQQGSHLALKEEARFSLPPPPVITLTASAGIAALPPAAAPPAPPVFLHSEAGVDIEVFCSLALTSQRLAGLAELVGTRNRFVCLQLCTMAKEQHVSNLAAAASGDEAALAKARALHLGVARAEGTVVAAAIFYRRHLAPPDAAPLRSSPADAEQACSRGLPHAYIQLICTSQPAKGYGSVLLRAVERFVVLNAARPGGVTHLRLLSVESARQFYARHGYRDAAAEGHHEMVKPLSAATGGG